MKTPSSRSGSDNEEKLKILGFIYREVYWIVVMSLWLTIVGLDWGQCGG